MRILNFFIPALFFTSLTIANAQSVIGTIQSSDSLCNYSIPADAELLLDNITKVTILFDDPDKPEIDMPVKTDMEVFVRISDKAIEYYIRETFKNGRTVLSDYIIVQKDLPFPMRLESGKVISFHAGYSPTCPDVLCAVGFTERAFFVRRYAGVIFLERAVNLTPITGDEKKL